MRHGLYPVADWDKFQNPPGYTVNLKGVINKKDNLDKFMLNGGVSTPANSTDYIPMLDEKGPFMFFPPHCVALPDAFIHESPIIGYIKSNSTIQAKLVQQLKAHVDNQVGTNQLVTTDKDIRKFISEHRNKGKSQE